MICDMRLFRLNFGLVTGRMPDGLSSEIPPACAFFCACSHEATVINMQLLLERQYKALSRIQHAMYSDNDEMQEQGARGKR
jgi:hypothetical protein